MKTTMMMTIPMTTGATSGSPPLECIFGNIPCSRDTMRYSGIQQIQLDIARYARIQLEPVGYSRIQWIWCNMARYRDTAGYTKDTVRYR